MAFGLHVPDDGLDDRATAQLALDDTEDAALLAGDEDATGILRIVAAVPLVDIGSLDRTAGERLGTLDDVPQGCPSYGLSGIALACSTNTPPGARRLLVTTEAFTLNS